MKNNRGLVGWCFDKASAFLCFIFGHEWTDADCDGFRYCVHCGDMD